MTAGASPVDARWRWILWANALALGATGVLGSTALGDPLSAAPVGPLTSAQLAGMDLSPYPGGAVPPDFNLRTPEGRTVSLAKLRGQVVLVNFWATWCRECLPEMRALEVLHRRFGARGLAVVGVNSREGPTTVRRYARDLALTFPLVVDGDGAIAVRYGVIGLPATFLIGRNGRAVALAVGAREWASAAAVSIVETLLATTSGEFGQRP